MNQRKSLIWKYYLETGKDYAQCQICSKLYSRRGRSTTPLKSHLKSMHPNIYEEYCRLLAQEQEHQQETHSSTSSVPQSKETSKLVTYEETLQKINDVRRMWECLIDVFQHDHNKYMKSVKKNPRIKSPYWTYYNKLLFLESHIGQTQQLSRNTALDATTESMDGSTLDDLPNFADITIKTEILQPEISFVYEDVDLYEIEGDLNNTNQGVCQEEDESKDDDDDDEPLAQRFKSNKEDMQLNVKNSKDQTQNWTSAQKKRKLFATATATTKKKTQVDATIIQEYKNMLLVMQQQLQQQHNNDDDDDYHFALSLVPTMREWPKQNKMLLRIKMQQLLCEEVAAVKEIDKKE